MRFDRVDIGIDVTTMANSSDDNSVAMEAFNPLNTGSEAANPDEVLGVDVATQTADPEPIRDESALADLLE